jgi:hypothetical protein
MHPDFERWLLDNTTINYDSHLVSSAFLKDYLPFSHQNRGCIVLKNSCETIKTSINLPNIQSEIVHCRPNITLNSLISYYLARNMEPQINSSRIPRIFQGLGISFKTIDEYLIDQPVVKHTLIKRKAEEQECIICLEQVEYPSMVNCCYNLFCGKCLIRNMIVSHKCPTCREVLETGNICCLKTLTPEEKIIGKNKTEIFLDILENNKNAKIIVYSSFDNIYYQLFEAIDKLGLKSERIVSNLFSLLKTIKNFNEGDTNILFISNIELIRGVSLTTASHLIFFHEPPVCELKEILIHSANRIGRKQELKTIHLFSEIQV